MTDEPCVGFVTRRVASGWYGLTEVVQTGKGLAELTALQGAAGMIVANAGRLGARAPSQQVDEFWSHWAPSAFPGESADAAGLAAKVMRLMSEHKDGIAQVRRRTLRMPLPASIVLEYAA